MCPLYITSINRSLLQYSCLGHPMDRGAWQAHKRVRHYLSTKGTTDCSSDIALGKSLRDSFH